MARTDELKERIRQQPLNDRLEESRRRIGDMCSKGRCPKMTIPVQHDDDDFYINTTLADAQATIAALETTILKMGENAAVVAKDAMAAKEQVAALQARVKELEEWVQDQSTANLETMRHMDEMQSRAMDAESQLTQRTAELEEANHTASTHQALWREACDQRDKAQAELEAAKVDRDEAIREHGKESGFWGRSCASLLDKNKHLQAELERVRERVGPQGLEVVIIGEVGHYVSAAVKEELERVRADNKALDKWRADVTVSLQRPEGAFFVDVPQHIKDLVRERDELRTLIAALPKVEGKIEVYTFKNTNQVVVTYNRGIIIGTLYGLDHAKPVAALYEHRQGMEG